MKFAMQFNKYFPFDPPPPNNIVRCHCAGRKKDYIQEN